MTEISENDAANLVTLIYGINLPGMIGGSQDNSEDQGDNYTLGDVIKNIKKNPTKIMKGDDVGGQMSLEEYMSVVDQIEQSETLMSMEIVNFVEELDTDFRAFTLVDPDGEVKPTIIFRGTAGDYQWADNFAGLFSTQTPSQMRAQQYVVNSGYDHVVTAGHSKGGNMAAAVVYMLPEGMVDTAYSFDGQGVSESFLGHIPADRIENALNRVHNINEYRDIVSRLLVPTGRASNRKYIDSGVLFDDTEYATADLGTNLKMSVFHAHKPNYFTLPDATERNQAYYPNMLYFMPFMLSNTLDDYSDSRGSMIAMSKSIAEALYTEESETEWSEAMWNAVYDAEQVYVYVRKIRDENIRACLENFTHIDMEGKRFVQPEGSLVVEGALLTCQYCSGVGRLRVTEKRADLIQGKRVAVKTDNKEENIQMDFLECARIDWTKGWPVIRACVPEICHDWLLTDPDKLRGPRQEEAVLKKSVLGCLRGGMIEILHNGQMTGEDAGEAVPEYKKKRTRKGQTITKEQFRSILKTGMQDSLTSGVAMAQWADRRVEAVAEGAIGTVRDGIEYIKESVKEMERSASQAYENFVIYLIEQRLRQIMK